MSQNLTNLLYLVTIVTFILALRFLSSPAHARRGNQIGAAGMLLAIVVTWIKVGTTSWWAIAIGMAVGGGAAALVSWAEFHRQAPLSGDLQRDISVSLVLSALIGSISFSGSMIAFAKLQELIGGRPITYAGQLVVNLVLLGAFVAGGASLVAGAEREGLGGAVVGGWFVTDRMLEMFKRRPEDRK
jgi:NAD(P) transhydrogenase subunit beta